MSTPETPMEEPRYGRRSDEWTPEPQAPSAADPASTPWPQYGQLSDQAPASSGVPAAGPYATGSTTGAPSSQPYGAPAAQPYGAPYGASQPVPGPGVPAQDLPGRGGAIAMIVGGIASMLIIAPVIFFIALLSGLNLGEIARTAEPIRSGQTITVSEAGTYTVIGNAGDVYSCTLTDSAGTSHDMDYYASTSPTFWAQGLTPGDYVVDCATEGRAELVGIGGLDVNDAVSSTLAAMGWSALVGFIGLILTIWGIVKLIRVNRRRREIQRTYGIY